MSTTFVPGFYKDQKSLSDPLELELQAVMSHYVCSGNQNQVLYKSNKYSELLNSLSIL